MSRIGRDFWCAGDRRVIALSEMTDDHLWNVIRFLERNGAIRGREGYATLDDLRVEYQKRCEEREGKMTELAAAAAAAQSGERIAPQVDARRFAELDLDEPATASTGAKTDPYPTPSWTEQLARAKAFEAPVASFAGSERGYVELSSTNAGQPLDVFDPVTPAQLEHGVHVRRRRRERALDEILDPGPVYFDDDEEA